MILKFTADPTEMKKSSKNAVFYFRDSNAYFDTRSVLLHVKWYAYKDDDKPLEATDKVTFVSIYITTYLVAIIMCLSYSLSFLTITQVSCGNPPTQHIIEAAIVNIGMLTIPETTRENSDILINLKYNYTKH